MTEAKKVSKYRIWEVSNRYKVLGQVIILISTNTVISATLPVLYPLVKGKSEQDALKILRDKFDEVYLSDL